jgi:hypothetical protein
MEISAAITENSMEVLKKLKIELPYDPTIPLLDISKEHEVISSDKQPKSHVYLSIVHNRKDMESVEE